LLALCASHWKADHILGNMLLVKMAADSEDDDSNSSVDQDNKSPRSKNRKWPACNVFKRELVTLIPQVHWTSFYCEIAKVLGTVWWLKV
jgi:hypothetical protein